MDKVGSQSFVAMELMGGLEGARGYRFAGAGDEFWVLWQEDGGFRLPGEPEMPQNYTFEIPSGTTSVTGTDAVTDPDAPPPEPRPLWPNGLTLNVELSSVPLFIEFD